MSQMDYPSMPEDNKKWQAENDAHCLAEAELITGDPKRLKAAQKAAEEMVKKEKDDAAAMEKVGDITGFKYGTMGDTMGDK